MLSVNYAECRYAQCRGAAETCRPSVVYCGRMFYSTDPKMNIYEKQEGNIQVKHLRVCNIDFPYTYLTLKLG